MKDDDINKVECTTKVKATPPLRPALPSKMSSPSKLQSSIQRHFEELTNLLPERVRWFYNEDKKWSPFCGLDSLRIEQCYRRLPSRDNGSLPELYEVCTVRGELYDVDVVKRVCTPVYWKADPVKIRRGTWFKGATNENNWTPIDEEEADLIENSHQQMWRSMGINPTADDNMKNENRKRSCDVPDGRHVLGRLQLSGQYVEWCDIDEVWLHSEGMTSKILRGMVSKMGGATGVHATPLHRGYHTDSSEKDSPAHISHLVFVIHGIGQLMHNSVNNCCQMLRCNSKQIEDKYFKNESENGRVEFVPIEWRSSLKLDEGVVDLVTPHTVREVRNLINTSMMDIMYYTSPFYREEIISCVQKRLNKLYSLFLSRNPNFKEHGSVSILAHSLGSVIIYDILERWDLKLRDQDSSAQNRFVTDSLNYFNSIEECKTTDQSNGAIGTKSNPIHLELAQTQRKLEELDFKLQHQMEKNGEEDAEVLKFKVKNCFLLGSPLAVFFTLRGLRPGEETEKAVLPQIVCKNIFNIYDQCDPVAYRLEPMFRERYAAIEPVHIKSYSETNYHYDEDLQPLQPDNNASTGNWLIYALLGRTHHSSSTNENGEDGNSMPVPQNIDLLMTNNSSNNQTRTSLNKGWFSRMFSRKRIPGDSSDAGEDTNNHEGSKNEILSRRVDYILCENKTQYWSAITSHLSYWDSLDLTRFVLHRIYHNINDT